MKYTLLGTHTLPSSTSFFIPAPVQWGTEVGQAILRGVSSKPLKPETLTTTPKKPIPTYLQKDRDPSLLQRGTYTIKDAIVGHPDIQHEAERVLMDPEQRQILRDRFTATRPWVPPSTEDPFRVSTTDLHQQGVITMIWQLLKDALGYVVWNFQDLSRYFTQQRNGVWSWFDLSHDVGFLWRLGISALLAMGAIQLIGVTDSLVRLIEGLMNIIERIFGLGWSQLNGIRQSVMEIFSG